MTTLRERLPGVAFLALVLVAWEALGWRGGVKVAFLPPPSTIVATLAGLLGGGGVLGPLAETLARFLAGYALAVVLAIATGLLMGYFAAVHNLLELLVELVRPIPKAALVPPLMLFLGYGDAMKIVIVALAVFFPVLINTVQGVRGVDPVLVQTGRTFGVSAGRILWKILLPAAMPQILAGMHISLGIGLILVVIAELISGGSGLGSEIITMQRSFRVREMYAWVVVLAVTGYALNLVFHRGRRRILHWHRGLAAAHGAEIE
jgi:ABC-type nitrate/sulfonate/bicarbonate transport system permease component